MFWNPNSPIAPNPHLEGEPQRGLDCPGMKKAAPEIRKRAGSRCGYVLCSQRKVKARRLRPNQGGWIRSKRKPVPVEVLKTHARQTAAACRVLRQTSGALGRTEGNGAGFAAVSRVVRAGKVCGCQRLRRVTRRTGGVTLK